MLMGGVDTGWTFYTPYSTAAVEQPRHPDRARRLHLRLLVDPDRPQLHRHHPHHARAGDDLVPDAAVHLGALRHQPDHDPRHAGDRRHAADAGARARLWLGHLRSRARRRPGALPAPVLVLLAPGGLHHGAAGDGRDQRADRRVQPQADLRLHVRRLLEPRHRVRRLPGLGPPHVHEPASRSTPRWSSRSSAISSRFRRRSRCSTGRRRSTRARCRGRRRCSTPSASSACSRSAG